MLFPRISLFVLIFSVFALGFDVRSEAHLSSASTSSSLWPIFHTTFSKEVMEHYQADLGLALDMENPEYFGGSSYNLNRFVIAMGSLYRQQDELQAMILCHELSHLLGGEPKKTDSTWASTETQSDFYAVSVCLKKMIRAAPQRFEKVLIAKPQYKILDEKCRALEASYAEKKLCRQVGRIGHDFFLAVHKFMNVPGFPQPRFTTHSTEEMREAKNKYPTLQCRMEVVLHGALCLNSKCTKPACL